MSFFYGRRSRLLEALIHEVRILVSTIADLKAAADQLAANNAALTTEWQALSVSIDNLVSAFSGVKNSAGMNSTDQAMLDAAVQQVTDAASSLATQTQSMSGEAARADEADGAAAPPAENPPAEGEQPPAEQPVEGEQPTEQPVEGETPPSA